MAPRRPDADLGRTDPTTDTEQIILLDRKTRLIRSGARLAIQRLQPDGSWDMVAAMQGGARSITRWCVENGVSPTRDAEVAIAKIPEAGFRERS